MNDTVLTKDEQRYIRTAKIASSPDEDVLLRIIDRLVALIEDYERGQITPRGRRVFRNVKAD